MERVHLLKDTLIWCALCALILTQSACAIPLLLGVKEYPTENGSIKFITGADFTIGANGTDTVDNRRGISPKELR